MKKILYIAVFSVCIVAISIIMIDEKEKNNQTNSSSNEQYGFSLRLFDVEHSLTEKQLTHVLKSQDSYRPQVEVGNFYPERNKYRLYFFLDYVQTPITIDNQKKDFVDLNIEAYKNNTFDFVLPPIEEGRHDFVVLALRNPKPIEKDEFIPSQLNYNVRRTTIIKGKDIPPRINYVPYKNLDYSNNKSSLLFISDRPTNDWKYLKNFTNSEFWLNIPSFSNKIAIIALLGDKQVEIKQSYVDSNINGTISFPIHLDKKNAKPQNLIIATFENPYERMEDLDGNFIKFHNFSVLNKVRVE